MKIEITEAFQKIVENAAHFSVSAGKISQMPVYACVKVEIKSGVATVSAANGHAFYTASAPGFGLLDGSFVVDAKLFSSALGRFAGGTVEDQEKSLSFVKGNQKFSLATFTEMDMPAVPEVPGSGTIALGADTLLEALGTVSYAMLRDDATTNVALSSVHITSKDGKLRFDAVDGFRVGRYTVPTEQADVDVLLPSWVVRQALADELIGASKEVTVFSGGGHVGVIAESVRIVSDMLAGNSFDADQVFQSYPNSVTCNAAALREVLKTSRLVQDTAEANAKLPLVLDIQPAEKKISISLRSAGAALSDEIPLTEAQTEAGVRIGVNTAYLADAIAHLDAPDILFSYNQALSPMILKPAVAAEDGAEIAHLILPVRLKDGE